MFTFFLEFQVPWHLLDKHFEFCGTWEIHNSSPLHLCSTSFFTIFLKWTLQYKFNDPNLVNMLILWQIKSPTFPKAYF